MTIDIQALIEQRPHLKDPLEFYARWQLFQREALKISSIEGSHLSAADSKTYPREEVEAVFQLFVSIFDLPGEELEPLGQALAAGDIDFMRLPLGELPDLPLSCGKEALATILFLLSRPYFQTLGESFPQNGSQWENGRCPMCSALPALSSIAEGPQRRLHCSFCGTEGPYRFTGCPNCGNEDTSKLNILIPEDESGFRISTCDECKTYVKIA
jgi:FdhE protein